MEIKTEYISDIYTDKAYHWLLFLKYNNFAFLRKDSLNKSPRKVITDHSQEALDGYHEINDQIIEEFGMQESFLAHKKLQEEIALLKLRFLITGNRMNITFWTLKELEIQPKEEKEEHASDLSKEISIVSRNLGVGIIDIKDYSIFQYLTAKISTK